MTVSADTAEFDARDAPALAEMTVRDLAHWLEDYAAPRGETPGHVVRWLVKNPFAWRVEESHYPADETEVILLSAAYAKWLEMRGCR